MCLIERTHCPNCNLNLTSLTDPIFCAQAFARKGPCAAPSPPQAPSKAGNKVGCPKCDARFAYLIFEATDTNITPKLPAGVPAKEDLDMDTFQIDPDLFDMSGASVPLTVPTWGCATPVDSMKRKWPREIYSAPFGSRPPRKFKTARLKKS